jgi:hypothetical protein
VQTQPPETVRSEISPAEQAFRLKEFELLKGEIAAAMHDFATLQVSAVGAIGAAWAWLVSHPEVPTVAWWIPVLFSVLGGLRSLALAESVGRQGSHIAMHIERAFLVDPSTGYQLDRRKRSLSVWVAGGLFWLVLVTASLFAVGWRRSMEGVPVGSSGSDSLGREPPAADAKAGPRWAH